MKKIVLFGCLLAITSITFAQRQMHVWKNGTATSFARTDVASTTFNSDIEDISSDLRKKYLVEKITWYDDETNHKEAYYEYDNNNRLERRIIHSTYFEQGRVKYDTIVDNYEYTGGNLTKISHKDMYISYTYDLEYDNVGRLITSKYGNNIMHFCHRGGKMDSIWYDNDPECYTILKYDEHGNIVKEIMRVPEMDDIWGETPTGDYVFIENEYEYDDKIRPFFNIDNAFVYDPIFGQGTTHSEHIRMLSTNNLIKYSRSSWHYTYNEEGLPIELRSRFEGVTPANDPKYVFTYRKIEKTESLADLFPTLWGLQRTHTIEMYDYAPNDGKRNGGYPELTAPTKDTIIDGKTYLQYDEYYSSLFLREENNKVLIYSSMLQEDLVLYDYTLGVGDSLHAITGDDWFSDANFAKLDKAKDIFTYVVTEVSTITLIDGIERKKWTLQNQYLGIMEYVEGIGCFGEKNSHSGDFFRLIYNHPYETESIGNLLVCVSKNGQLLYSMSQEEMDGFTLTCKCLSQSSYKDQWCDTWNVLYHGWDPEGGDDPYMPYTFIYQLEEDTTINDLTYQRLTGRFSLSTMPSNKEYVAALRFAENKKVFVHYDNIEYLLYDFGAQVGDTLEIFGGIDHYKDFKTLTHVITEIDSLDDGRLQIYSNAIIQASEGYETPFERLYPKIWIEGVGSKDGIVQNSATNRIGSGVTALLCAYRDEDCIYTTDNPYYTPYGCVHNDSFFTATEEVKLSTQSAQKIMYNGQLLILHDGKTYNIMGMEVMKLR